MGRPLDGKWIVITRAREQAKAFADDLKKLGAGVILFPTIRIVPPPSFRPLDRAVRNLESFDWLIFTSSNAVEYFHGRLRRFRKGVDFKRLRTCAIGPVTARAMRRAGIPVNKVSPDYVAESILSVLPKVRGQRILIPQALKAREMLPKVLKERGARVIAVPCYRTVLDRTGLKAFRKRLRKGPMDCVTFTSSSTVRNFIRLLGRRFARANPSTVAASIGPITTEALKRHGWKPAIVAKKPLTSDLRKAIIRFYERPT